MVSYHFQQIRHEGQVEQYQVFASGKALTFGEVWTKWEKETDFVEFYNQMLGQSAFDAFFWEHPPLTPADWGQAYVCKLLNSPYLALLHTAATDFEPYFQGEAVVSFDNLGGDARLVVPSPQSEKVHYLHLANFVRAAPPAQIQIFWQKVGQEMQAQTQSQPCWLNTSGLGVHWLHVRLDARPKYCQDRAYAQPHYWAHPHFSS
ncbi:MAG: hypothetical protein OHK0053_24050 [Microscillaceae bacterium]